MDRESERERDSDTDRCGAALPVLPLEGLLVGYVVYEDLAFGLCRRFPVLQHLSAAGMSLIATLD